MTHPLTYEIMDRIHGYEPGSSDVGETNILYNEDDMRLAADWQLEQVIRYLENDLKFVLWTDDFMDKFKKAMRPQQADN